MYRRAIINIEHDESTAAGVSIVTRQPAVSVSVSLQGDLD